MAHGSSAVLWNGPSLTEDTEMDFANSQLQRHFSRREWVTGIEPAHLGVSFEVCADPRLVPALTALGYDRQCGNWFIRTQGTPAWVIDVLAPSYLGRLMSNELHGNLVVDEISGLLDALRRLPPILVAAARS
jgi:hypothetical protein